MIVGLASPRVASSVDDGLERVRRCMADAPRRAPAIVCFPEAYLPGLRGQDFDVPAFDEAEQERALTAVAGRAGRTGSRSFSAWSGSRRRAVRSPRS